MRLERAVATGLGGTPRERPSHNNPLADGTIFPT
jgi:hypothetical protein